MFVGKILFVKRSMKKRKGGDVNEDGLLERKRRVFSFVDEK